MEISTTSAIKMTTLLSSEDRQALSQSIVILDAIYNTLTDERCDTIALLYGEELHDDNLQDAIQTLETVLHNLPEETEIWS